MFTLKANLKNFRLFNSVSRTPEFPLENFPTKAVNNESRVDVYVKRVQCPLQTEEPSAGSN